MMPEVSNETLAKRSGMPYFIVLGSVFFALICAIMANGKNRNALLWCLLGSGGGIVSFIVLALLPYLCPFCRNVFGRNSDGLHCGSCGEVDQLSQADLQKLEEFKALFSDKGWKIKVNGVQFKLVQSTGATLKFVGMKALEDYVHGTRC